MSISVVAYDFTWLAVPSNADSVTPIVNPVFNDENQFAGDELPLSIGFISSSAGYISFDGPPGANVIHVVGINDSDQVVGNVLYDGGAQYYGFIYADGAFTLLQGPSGATEANPRAINDLGQVLGTYTDSSGHTYGFIYTNGSYAALTGPAGAATFGVRSINDLGQVLGSYTDSSGHAYGFIYAAGSYVTLTGPAGATSVVSVNAISDLGQVVGTYTESGHSYGFIYSNGDYTLLDGPPGTTSLTPTDINDLGQVVGSYADSGGQRHQFEYIDGDYIIVNGPAGTANPVLYEINNSGQIFGENFGTGEFFFASPVSVLVGAVNKVPNATTSTALDYANGATVTNPSGVMAVTDSSAGATLAASVDTADESVTYQGSSGQTYSLTSAQIQTFEAAFQILTQTGITNGEIDWTYGIPNSALSFLGAGESITVTVPVVITDSGGGSVTQDVVVTINGANDNPVAKPVSVKVENSGTVYDTSAATGVLASDSDPNIHDTLYISAVNGLSADVGHSVAGRYGMLTLNTDGTYTYVENTLGKLLSALNISLLDTFNYTIADGHNATASSTLSFDTRESPPPVAKADIATVSVDATVSENAANGVLVNDSDPNGYSLTVTSISTATGLGGGSETVPVSSILPGVISGKYGALTLNADGSYSYAETASSVPNGAHDVFSYSVSDGHGGTASSTLTVDVTAPPPPTIDYTSLVNISAVHDLTSNSINVDLDGTALTSPTQSFMVGLLGQPNVSLHRSSTYVLNHEETAYIDKNTSIGKVTGLDKAVESLQSIFKAIDSAFPDLLPHLGTAGMLNVRLENPTVPVSPDPISNHSWGIAIDITVNGSTGESTNGTGEVFSGIADIIPYFNAAGWVAGAGWGVASDNMHFEVSEETLLKWYAPAVTSDIVKQGTGTEVISGSAAAGETISVYDGTSLIRSTTSDTKTGNWTITVQTLSAGVHAIEERIQGTNLTSKTVYSSQGNDILIGGDSSNTFVFSKGFSHDVIQAFSLGHDVIDFNSTLFSSVADVLSHITQVGANSVITYDSGDTVTVLGVQATNFHATDFQIS